MLQGEIRSASSSESVSLPRRVYPNLPFVYVPLVSVIASDCSLNHKPPHRIILQPPKGAAAPEDRDSSGRETFVRRVDPQLPNAELGTQRVWELIRQQSTQDFLFVGLL